MKYPTQEDLRAAIAQRLFGSNVVQNNLRSEVVEEIVSTALSLDWKHCSGDWAGWDFEHINGSRLEVKQSAARQSWNEIKEPNPRFDIAKRKRYWIGSSLTELNKEQRLANIYIFAWHSIIDATCNHFDVNQWQFFVVDEQLLPSQKSIGLMGLTKINAPCCYPQIEIEIAKILN